MASPPSPAEIEAALREERGFVLSLGGYALELAGGVLLVHERIPVPRFNFVQSVRLHRRRQSAFLERVLDHYFQRALRPTIRVETPVPEFLDATLRQMGFRPASEPWSLLLRRRPSTGPATSPFEVRRATAEELPWIASFWTGEADREEFLRALTVAMEHPNPHESVVPGVALRGGVPASAGLLHVDGFGSGIHGVVTQPSERGRGAATALVAGLLQEIPAAAANHPVAMWSDHPRLETRLETLGFGTAARYAVYALPPDAELALPSAGPPGPPRWRPPRRAASESR